MVRIFERASRNSTASHGNDIFRLGHLVVKTTKYGGHFVYYRAGDHDKVGLTRTGTGHLKPESRHVIARSSHRHKFDTTATGSECKRPERIGSAPIYNVVENPHHHVCSVGAELLNHFFERFIILEILVFHRFYFRFFHFHSNAPFFHA